MRIITGRAKGTQLAALKGLDIRPTLDRVKESLFSQIQPWLEGASFLDLFAGTGGIGLEAWSRGASPVVLVEKDPKVVQLTSTNIAKCRAEEEIELLRADAFSAIEKLAGRGMTADIVYLDPPYPLDLHASCLETLAASPIVKPSSLVIAERHRKAVLAENYGKMSLVRERKMGDTVLSFYAFGPFFD